MSVGHRVAAPTTPKFTSDAVIERYLHPVHQPGCGKHISPNCLCDVKVRLPASMNRAPIAFAHVQTPDDLVRAAADVWMRYDVLGPVSSRYKDPNQAHNDRDYQFNIDLNSTSALRAAAEAVAGGASLDRAQEEHKLPREMAYVIRRAYDIPPTGWFPSELTVTLLDQGHTLESVSDMLFERFGRRWSKSSLCYWYEKTTGTSISRSRAEREVDTLETDEG